MADEPAPSLAGLRILIVEDEYIVAELLCLILETLGCNVVGPCATVAAAVAAVHANALDGAILDANLGGDHSGPVAAALQAAAVPFVVATGYGTLPVSEPALGNAPRISKPFKAPELEACMKAAFINNQ